MRIAIFSTVPPDTYSGGRYLALMMAEALVLAGHDVCFVANCEPIFLKDFARIPVHGRLDFRISPDFDSNLPEGDFDAVVLIPGTRDICFYLRTRIFALKRHAHLVLWDFESGRWFNAVSPFKRSLKHWRRWKQAARQSSLVISSTQEGERHARTFYPPTRRKTHYGFCYPAINTYAANAVPDGPREKRIVAITRFSVADHKGGARLASIIGDAMRGYTLVLIVGTGEVPPGIHEELAQACRDHGVTLEIKYRLSDVDKFAEYKRARLMLFPSYFEGYGYPPIEAQYCNLPCVVFDLPVLRETSGERLIYAEHGDWEDFKRKVEGVLSTDGSPPETRSAVTRIASLEGMSERLDKLFRDLASVPLPAAAAANVERKLLRAALYYHDPYQRTRIKKLFKRQQTRIKRRIRSTGRGLRKLILGLPRFLIGRTGPTGVVCYYPPFDSSEKLTSHYHRAAWYLPRVEGCCESVRMFVSRDLAEISPGPRPPFMCAPAADPAPIRMGRGGFANFRALLLSDLILTWKGSERSFLLRVLDKVFGIGVADVDTDNPEAIEYGAYCSLIWKFLLPAEKKTELLDENRIRFNAAAAAIQERGFRRACVFGTGPSLEKAFEFDFADCLTIVCNSIVHSEELLDHIKPKFICAGDVVSHYGISLYAEKFREDLIRALSDRDLFAVGTANFGYLLTLQHPEIRDRMILIEQTHEGPRFDLLDDFGTPMLDSILNIAMLPIAATFTREIWLLGCDGRSTKRNNEDFWAHAPGAHYPDLVETGRQCHPTFDVNRQKTTLQRFNRSTEKTVLEGENKLGIVYRCLEESTTPILSERTVPPAWLDEARDAKGTISLEKLGARLNAEKPNLSP